jgi:hypothetical protein
MSFLNAAADEDVRYDKVCADLEAAMNEGLAQHVVEGRAAAVMRMNRPMPPLLAQRYNAYVSRAVHKVRTRTRLILAGIAGAFILIGGSAAAYFFLTSRSEELTKTIKAIDEAVARFDVGGAEIVLATVARDEPHVYANAEVQARALRVAEMRKGLDAFVQLVGAAKAACTKLKTDTGASANPAAALELVRAQQPPTEEQLRQARTLALSPEQKAAVAAIEQDLAELSIRVSLDELKAAIAAAPDASAAVVQMQDRQANVNGKLDRAKAAAQKPNERGRIDVLAQEYEQIVKDTTDKHETVLGERLRKLNGQYTDLAQDAVSPDETFQARAATLQEEIAKFQGTRDLSSALRAEAATLSVNVRKMVDEHQDIKVALASIAGLFDQPDALAQKLTDFTLKFKNHPLTADFQKAVGMAPSWRATAAWRSFASTWGTRIRVQDSATIKTRTDQIDKYLADHPDVNPYKDIATTYRAYLEVAREAIVNDQLHYLTETMEYIRKRFFTKVQLVCLQDGRRFYVTRVHESAVVSVDYIVNANMEIKTASFPRDKLNGAARTAPQTAFAASAERLIAQFSAAGCAGWETFYLRLADLVTQQREMDAILAAKTLKEHFLVYAAACTPFKSDELKQFATRWDRIDLDTPLWMDPGDTNAEQARSGLVPLGSFQPMIADVEGRLSLMSQAVTAHQPVGLLLNADIGLRLPPGTTQGTLVILWTSDTSKPPMFEKIGTCEGGRAKLDANAKRYPKGTPVYISTR